MALPPLRHNPRHGASARGSVGSSVVWDEATRAARRSALGRSAGDDDAELAALVQGAVARTVQRRGEGLPATQRDELAAGLQTRIMALLGDDAEPARAPANGTAAIALDPAVESRLRAELESIGAGVGGMNTVRERIVGLVLQAAQSEVGEAVADGTRLKLRQIDVLERRIAKLEGSLERTRSAVTRVASTEAVDQGLSSFYRTVQGLAECDALIEVKREMLVRIYRANLVLQKRRPG